MQRFGKRLEELMLQKNVTQKDLAEKLGVSQPMISKYLNGSIPDGAKLIAIAKIFKVSSGYLLGDIDMVMMEPELKYGDGQRTYYQKTIEVLEEKIQDLFNVLDQVEGYNDGLKKIRGTLVKEIEIKKEFIKSIGV